MLLLLLGIYVLVAVVLFAWGCVRDLHRDTGIRISTQFGGVLLASLFWPLAAVVILVIIPVVVVQTVLGKGDD